jgi:hypothetical protein
MMEGISMKRRLRPEDITCRILNPELMENNSNLSDALFDFLCKDLSTDQIKALIHKLEDDGVQG